MGKLFRDHMSYHCGAAPTRIDMFWEKKLESWLNELRERVDVPARLVLWNGKQFDLGKAAEPQVTLTVNSAGVIPHLLTPSIDTLAEAYVTRKIDLDGRLTDIIAFVYDFARKSPGASGSSGGFAALKRRFAHTRQSDKKAIQFHYDVSDAFYRVWLGETMVYSCAYFENGDEDLDTAQLKKIDHILKKIGLQPGQTLLDIGCGWGALVLRAAQRHGVKCVGVTLSENQCATAKERVAKAGLSDLIEIRLQDYRDVEGQFDRITSVGMFEHVGRVNLTGYFAKVQSLLAPGGVAMNHGVTSTDPEIGKSKVADGSGFIDKYVFPDNEIPHIGHVLEAMQRGGLEAVDVESLRRHYAHTLTCWADAFERQTEAIKTMVDEEKFRIWRVYLAGCAHAFQQDQMSIYQVICRKAGEPADTLPWSRKYIYA
jgi:cyclopropane-fatty-acyl-phospholipid synthase